MTMIQEAPEIEYVTKKKVSCDGGGGALGHPKVWYVIPDDLGWIECGYCDKRFVFVNPDEDE